METNIMWWKNSLIYQIYPLSFKDSNDDGIGDIKGIISKIPYLKDYGVDVIWLSPIYKSPMDDNGYDISNYQEVNEIFGTNEDLDTLINEVHKHGMKIIMDLVINHTSDLHDWFLKSKTDTYSKYRDYYIWSDQPSPKINSVFGGSAWTYDKIRKQYYFHLFSKRQPDLNWRNENLRLDVYKTINYWLDKGIDGFRMDVIDLIGKDIPNQVLSDGPYLEKYLNEMYLACFKNRDIMTVGEMGGISIKRAHEITSNPNLGINMTFQFSHLAVDEVKGMGKWELKKYNPKDLKDILIKNNELFKDQGWNTLFLSNHDAPRQVSRFGNLNYRTKSSQMLFTMLYLQRGTPYLYMGEEIGMTGIKFDQIEDYKDIETINFYHESIAKGKKESEIMESIYAKSRDNSRTPFQWNSEKNSGFSNFKPWIKVNPNYQEINLENEKKDPKSIYNFTKKLFQIRKQYRCFLEGDFKPIKRDSKETFIYLRKSIDNEALVITNLTENEVIVNLKEYQSFKVILSNSEINISEKTLLKPYQATILIKELNENDN